MNNIIAALLKRGPGYVLAIVASVVLSVASFFMTDFLVQSGIYIVPPLPFWPDGMVAVVFLGGVILGMCCIFFYIARYFWREAST